MPEIQNKAKFLQDLKRHEGFKDHIYLDHFNFKTFGYGHKVIQSDPESKLPVGTKVSQTRIDEVFANDVNIHMEECIASYPGFHQWPETAQHVVANMFYNVGGGTMSKFVQMNAALAKNDWAEAAKQMKNSRWYSQVGVRSQELVTRMESLSK